MKKFLYFLIFILFTKNILANELYKDLDCSTLVTKNIQKLEYCANKNDAFSQYNLAVIYRDGIGVKSDFDKAFHWFKKSADLGFSNAKANLSWFYKNGVAVKQDFSQALFWAEQAAKENNPIALNNLGTYYQQGIGVKKDLEKSILYFNKALTIDSNLPITKTNLGYSYFYGLGVKKDISNALKLTEEAANQGYIMAMNNLGVYYKDLGQEKLAFEWTEKAAQLGLTLAKTNLGFFYAKGIGIEKNKEKALYWLNEAQLKNDSQAFFIMGILFSENNNIFENNDKKAFELFKIAAEMGNGNAQYNLANWLFDGRFISKNELEAVKWYERAAIDSNISEAMYALYQIYSKGTKDIPKDPEKANYWLEKAKKNGFLPPQ